MKKLITLLLMLANIAAFGQINFEPGYFINNKSEKKTCLIKNIAWKNNPEEFLYKMAEGTEEQTAKLADIQEFSVENTYKFKRFEVKTELSSYYIDKMSRVKEPEWVTKTLFLKVLVEGTLNLYAYEQNDIIKYFYSTGDHSKAEQILFKNYISEGVIGENNHYKQQLFNLMRDKFNDINKFEKLKYKREPLVKLFSEYNGEDSKNHTLKQNKSRIDFKITPGVALNSLSIENGINPRPSFEFDQKVVFLIGAEVEYIMPFNNNKWSLFLNPNVQFYENTGSKSNYEYEVKYNSLNVPAGFRHYMFLNEKSKFFLDAAYMLSFAMGDAYIKYDTRTEKLDIEKESSFLAGAGYSYDRYSIELRYTFGHGILTNYSYWSSDYSSLAIMLGYRF